ncbi:hypothetical protein, partial [Treponema primitia]|uniref:hypothetical protein n=1 Tax=Treponema primitia TaxID=88058 RepID=UPI0002554DE8
MFLGNSEEKKHQKLQEYTAIINFAIATEKISNIIYKYCPVEHKSVIKFEVAIFVYYKISEIFDTNLYKYYDNVAPVIKDYIVTIGGYRDEFLEKRLNLYHNNKRSFDNLYKCFGGLINRALIDLGGDWEYNSDWNDFVSLINENHIIYNTN